MIAPVNWHTTKTTPYPNHKQQYHANLLLHNTLTIPQRYAIDHLNLCGAVYVRWIRSDNILSSTHYGGNESERFVQTFCARADVYYDIGGSGKQTSVLNSLTTEHIIFTAEEEDDVVMTIKLEPATKRFVERCVDDCKPTKRKKAGWYAIEASRGGSEEFSKDEIGGGEYT
eukprot:scaffold1551_cov206-Alexandrium_tamarense.AAC.10